MYDKPVDNTSRTNVKEAVLLYVRQCKHSPSLREIGKEVGIKSPATVMAILAELERDGLVGFGGEQRRVYAVEAA